MTRTYLKIFVLISAYFFTVSPQVLALNDTIPKLTESENHPLYFLDGKEVNISSLKKIDPCIIDKFDYIKSEEAAKTHGIKGRLGVYKMFSGKKPTYSNKDGHYASTFYIYGDSSRNVRQERLFGNSLDSLFLVIVKGYPNSYLAIDELRFTNKDGINTFLQKESAAFNILHANYAIDSVSKTMAELIFYTFKIYKAGRIYFSGSNFKNVITCNATDINCVRSNFSMCTIGSIITLEGCLYRNPQDGNEAINKTIKLN